jgi:putative FmdB family regulatory protein
MILFEYHCEVCVEGFEEMAKDADEVVACPHCNTSDHVNRVISPTGQIVLTGDGWYATDWQHK